MARRLLNQYQAFLLNIAYYADGNVSGGLSELLMPRRYESLSIIESAR